MKKSAAIQISIPEPCAQVWDAMQPAQGGRHCVHCQQVVVDFTRMTDAQLLSHFQNNSSGCGHFRTEQLGLTIRKQQKSRPNWWSRIAAGVLLSVSFTDSSGQRKKRSQHITHTQRANQKHSPRPAAHKLKGVLIKGERIYERPIIDAENPGGRSVTGAYEIERPPAQTSTSYYSTSRDTLTKRCVEAPKVENRRTFWQRLRAIFS